MTFECNTNAVVSRTIVVTPIIYFLEGVQCRLFSHGLPIAFYISNFKGKKIMTLHFNNALVFIVLDDALEVWGVPSKFGITYLSSLFSCLCGSLRLIQTKEGSP